MRLLTMAVGLCLGFATVCWGAELPYEIQWTQQLATSFGYAVTVDGDGNAYVGGHCRGSLGAPNAGSSDALVAKFDSTGNLKWAAQAGSSSMDFGMAVAADSHGNVYLGGYTYGSLCGPPSGVTDGFLLKYDVSGEPVWCRQFGSTLDDYVHSVAVDAADNVLVSGHTTGAIIGANAGSGDAYFAKYAPSGDLLWQRQFGTDAWDYGHAIGTDAAGHTILAASTAGSLAAPNCGELDVYLCKFDATGEPLWSRQMGTPQADEATALAIDAAGSTYITGSTRGSLGGPNAGLSDAFISKFGTEGDLQWTRQWGTDTYDWANSIAVDGVGNVYVTGSTNGNLGRPVAGYSDIFLTKFNTTGDLLWTMQFGTDGIDRGESVAVDAWGNVYLSGFVEGSLGGAPYVGPLDAFLVKLSPVPEPGSIALCVLFALIGAVVWRRRA